MLADTGRPSGELVAAQWAEAGKGVVRRAPEAPFRLPAMTRWPTVGLQIRLEAGIAPIRATVRFYKQPPAGAEPADLLGEVACQEPQTDSACQIGEKNGGIHASVDSRKCNCDGAQVVLVYYVVWYVPHRLGYPAAEFTASYVWLLGGR
jgi:hypothetical protein